MSRRYSLALPFLALLVLPLAAQDSEKKDLFGDPLPQGAVARMGTSRLRNEAPISAFAFSLDGKTIACGGNGSQLTTWNADTGRVAKRVALAGVNQITGLEYSKDGKTLAVAVAGTESGVRLLDGTTLEQKKSLVDPTRKDSVRFALALSPDSKTVLAYDLGTHSLLVWDAVEGEIKHRLTRLGDGFGAAPLVFLPDSKQFITQSSDRKLHLISVADGKSVRDLESAATLAAQTRISTRLLALVISPDGKHIYTRRFTDRAFQVIEVATAKLARTWENSNLGSYGSAIKAAITPDGRFLVESAANLARVWGLASGKLLREFIVGGNSTAFALSGDGKRLALLINYHLSVVELSSANILHGEAGHTNAPQYLAFTRDGKRLVSMGTYTLRVWDAATGKEEEKVRQYFLGCQHLTAGDKAARWINFDRSVYQFAYGARETTRLTTPRPITGGYANAVVAPDGKSAAILDHKSRKLTLVPLEDSKKERELANLPQNFYSHRLTFSPDSRYLAMSSSTDRVVTLFDVVAGVEIRKLLANQGDRFSAAPLVVFAADGRSLLKFDGETRVIETSSGGERFRIPRENLAAQPTMLWSMDGRLVVRAYPDGLVTVHDIVNSKELFRKNTEQGEIKSLALSRDGRRLATGGANTTILVWDVPAPAKIGTTLSAKDAWRDLENGDAARGFSAIAYFVANPDEAVKTFAERIKTQAAPDLKQIDQWIKDLDDDAFAVREKASEGLADIGAPALEKLEAALKDPPSLEVKRRCEVLVRKLKGGATVAPDRLRAVRAVEALEKIGTPAAKKTLELLAKQKMAPDVEAAIKGALNRLADES